METAPGGYQYSILKCLMGLHFVMKKGKAELLHRQVGFVSATFSLATTHQVSITKTDNLTCPVSVTVSFCQSYASRSGTLNKLIWAKLFIVLSCFKKWFQRSFGVGGAVRFLVVGTIGMQRGKTTTGSALDAWSSTWFHSNTGPSSTQYEQIPIIFGVWPFWPTLFFFFGQ